MGALILTGPPGAGKNSVAAAYAKLRERCAVIDVDLVRWMVLQPHRAPWDGEAGMAQQRLGVRHACMLARSFVHEDYDVLIHDVLSDETAKLYRSELAGLNPRIVLLMPSLEEVERRNSTRGPRLRADEIRMLYEGQMNLRCFDHKIDNSALSPQEVAEQLLRFI